MMLRANWSSSRNRKREKRFGDREIARAGCEYCGGVVAYKALEDASFYALNASQKYRDAFRLPPSNVHNDSKHLPFGFWELSRRAQAQMRRALLSGRRLSEWRPTPRHRQSQEENERVVDQVNTEGTIVGVLGMSDEGSQKDFPTFILDPHATGGLVVVRCPNCGSLNEVLPCPTDLA